MQNAHFASKIKIPKKHVKIYPTNHLQLFCAKNRSKIAKLIIFNQKLKMQKTREKRFYNNIVVGLCKKPLQKTPNIREMRAFWKSAIMQRL